MDTQILENEILNTPNFASKLCNLRITPTDENRAHINRVFTPDALAFLADLETQFGARRKALLNKREERQAYYDAGNLPDFNPETAHIRNGDWRIDAVPEILEDRRVEITGPVDRKMMINALNSSAKVFMADFEDATAPTFTNMLNGQINMQDYVEGTLSFTDSKNGKAYKVQDNPALMIVRPRGLHLDEAHLEMNGQALSASFVDFGLHIFHNGKALSEQGLGPFYYLPKLESHEEARLWNDIFTYAQSRLGIKFGTIKATVLIETLPAAFEMDEILYELRHHAAGLNCGRWDYIFSYIKTLRNHKDFILPNRDYVGMDKAFLKAYSVLLIKTCHKRGAHAMGGMAAQIPIKGDDDANAKALCKVRMDKIREAELYHDGTWVAHPGLIQTAMDVFDFAMPRKNNIHRDCREATPTQYDLLMPHDGEISEAGVRKNIAVALEYMSAWLSGRGAVPIHNLMEDAATAEICRMKLWQWMKYRVAVNADINHYVDRAHVITMSEPFFRRVLAQEFQKLNEKQGSEHTDTLIKARNILIKTFDSRAFHNFLTLPAYDALIDQTSNF